MPPPAVYHLPLRRLSIGFVALELLACLDAALALRTGASDSSHHVTARRNGVNITSVAFLLVGKTMRAKNRKGGAAEAGAENVVDKMTGEFRVVRESRGSRQDRPWSAFKKRVLAPSRSYEGVRPDIFVCTDVVEGEVPPEVSGVFSDASAKNQFERAHLCYQDALKSKAYDFYVRSAVGYTDDDMVFVVPGAIADKVFVSDSAKQRLLDQFKPPANWLEPIATSPETAWTQQLLAAGVETEPLSITGYPVQSNWPHATGAACAKEHIRKTQCGTLATQSGSE